MVLRIFNLWTFILIGRPQDYLTFLTPFRMVLAGSVILTILTLVRKKENAPKKLFNTVEERLFALFYCIMIFGIPFALHRRVAFEFTLSGYLSNMLFLYFFVIYIDSLNKLKGILFAICLATLGYLMFAMIEGPGMEGRLMIGDTFDPNDLAGYFVALFPLGFLFVGKGESAVKRVVALAVVVFSPIVILMTGSRGGFLALVIVSALLFFTRVVALKRVYKFAIVAGSLMAISLYSEKLETERFWSLFSLGEMKDDYNFTAEGGRLEIWKTGFKIMASNPITGIGAGCFGKAFSEVRSGEGRAPAWKTAHNSYILVGAELGVLGLLAFMSLILVSAKNFVRIMRSRTRGFEEDVAKQISGIVLVAFTGHLISALFLSQAYSVMFPLFFALSSVMRRIPSCE